MLDPIHPIIPSSGDLSEIAALQRLGRVEPHARREMQRRRREEKRRQAGASWTHDDVEDFADDDDSGAGEPHIDLSA